MDFFRKMSFADSTGDAIPFYHEGKYHIFSLTSPPGTTVYPARLRTGVVYAPMRVGEIVCGAAFGVLPMLSLFYPPYWLAGLAPFACIAWLIRQMRRRIGGYTGDCCGAAFLLCEGSFYVALVVLYRYYGSGTGAAYLG